MFMEIFRLARTMFGEKSGADPSVTNAPIFNIVTRLSRAYSQLDSIYI